MLTGYPDLDPEFWTLYSTCRSATMTSVERMFALYKSVEYVVRSEIPGDFVECGVWRGGSLMMMALTLQRLGQTRAIHGFDTFEGMPAPTAADIKHDTGESAAAILARSVEREDDLVWGIAGRDVAEKNVAATGYPAELVHFHVGRVEETIPDRAPDRIALLRLDTDWYESTRHELEHLYPRLAPGGVLIIDDYGFWRGARQATDEYFAKIGGKVLLNRIDDTARVLVKPLQ